MGKNLQNEVEYYYDSHPTLEDLMGETSIHADLVRYLMLVLAWLFRGQRCAIYENLSFYQTPNSREYPLAPDIAVIKGVDYRHLRSWKVGKTGKTGPAPHVVFEIASEETWKKDVEEKPLRYALMGVEEYFFYDPDDSPHWRHPRRKLLGWQFDTVTGAITEMVPDQEGRLWSHHLDSFLVPDGISLRLYDSNHQLRLTEAEALAQKLRSLGVNPDEI
ncbi:MAG: Uma2 family endonuclease [Ktedonobacteraceae bacterium]